ncbi:ulp1 protease family, C-terminal catalytic domain-containing protein [Tanacetum coccineum]
MGYELRHIIANEVLNLVDDFSAWNNFSWGEHMWIELHKRGFVFAFKIWLLETFLISKTWCLKEKDVIPRAVAWSNETLFFKDDYDRLFHASIIGSDSPVNNVFSNTIEFDHDATFISFMENPHNRFALMKKITDMEVEFPSRITSIEEYLKFSTSHNVEKTSNVVAECMSVDQNPSCGSDVKAGNKESVYVDCFVKISCATDVNAKNLDNDSMDVDHDPKVIEQQYVEPHLLGPNFIHEEDHKASSKNLELLLEGDELFEVQTLMKIIDFDIPKEVDVNPIIAHPKDFKIVRVPFEREAKSIKKRGLPLTAPDGKVIPAWTEVYFLINAEDYHWIIAELRIHSGVITFYDSLPSENSYVEDQKWWLALRECYAYQIPKLLIQTEVMEKKNIDPTNYFISYWYVVNVPRQGNVLGDCGIWVMKHLYRLLNNLPLEVSNPT